MLVTEHRPPSFSKQQVLAFIQQHDGDEAVALKDLGGYIDQNFHVVADDGRDYLFKIHDGLENEGVIDLQASVINRLADKLPELTFPTSHVNLGSESVSTIVDDNGNPHFARLLNYVSGELLKDAMGDRSRLLFDLGKILGETEIVARVNEWLSDRIFIRHRRHRRHFGDQPVRGDHPLMRIVDIGGIVIEGG